MFSRFVLIFAVLRMAANAWAIDPAVPLFPPYPAAHPVVVPPPDPPFFRWPTNIRWPWPSRGAVPMPAEIPLLPTNVPLEDIFMDPAGAFNYSPNGLPKPLSEMGTRLKTFFSKAPVLEEITFEPSLPRPPMSTAGGAPVSTWGAGGPKPPTTPPRPSAWDFLIWEAEGVRTLSNPSACGEFFSAVFVRGPMGDLGHQGQEILARAPAPLKANGKGKYRVLFNSKAWGNIEANDWTERVAPTAPTTHILDHMANETIREHEGMTSRASWSSSRSYDNLVEDQLRGLRNDFEWEKDLNPKQLKDVHEFLNANPGFAVRFMPNFTLQWKAGIPALPIISDIPTLNAAQLAAFSALKIGGLKMAPVSGDHIAGLLMSPQVALEGWTAAMAGVTGWWTWNMIAHPEKDDMIPKDAQVRRTVRLRDGFEQGQVLDPSDPYLRRNFSSRPTYDPSFGQPRSGGLR